MKKLITKIRHKLIRALGGEIPVPIKKPLIITETVPLSVIEARTYVPAEKYKAMGMILPNGERQAIESKLAETIGKDIVEKCGIKQGYNRDTDMYVFRVAVEVTGRSIKKAETCVVCGVIIPEGRQVCPKCEKDVK